MAAIKVPSYGEPQSIAPTYGTSHIQMGYPPTGTLENGNSEYFAMKQASKPTRTTASKQGKILARSRKMAHSKAAWQRQPDKQALIGQPWQVLNVPDCGQIFIFLAHCPYETTRAIAFKSYLPNLRNPPSNNEYRQFYEKRPETGRRVR